MIEPLFQSEDQASNLMKHSHPLVLVGGEGILLMALAQHKIFFEDGSFVDICGYFIFYRPGYGTGEGVVDDRIIGYITEDDRSGTGVVKFTCEEEPFSSPVTLGFRFFGS